MSRIHTIGHSTRSIDSFIELLLKNKIEALVDIRRFPASRRHPQFNAKHLAESLGEKGIGYIHLEGLGGRRKAEPDSVNTGWDVEGFRGYADYAATPEFQLALDELLEKAENTPVVIMCAEAVFWQCHRRIVADVLVARGHEVLHIIDENPPKPHSLTEFARVDNAGQVTYPARQLTLDME